MPRCYHSADVMGGGDGKITFSARRGEQRGRCFSVRVFAGEQRLRWSSMHVFAGPHLGWCAIYYIAWAD